MMPVWARPVRTLPRSFFSVSTDLAILSVAVFLMSLMFKPGLLSIVDECTLVFTHHDALQRAGLEDAEHVDRQLLVAAKCERRGVHDLQVLHERLVEGEARVARGVGILLRVRGVHAIDL